jgi:hypothetical protein
MSLKLLPGLRLPAALLPALAAGLVACAGGARQHDGTQPHLADHAHTLPAAPNWPQLSERAREQVRAVERSVAEFDTPGKAHAAGFRPALGVIPTMGVHWVNRVRMSAGIDFEQPDHLLFSQIDGEQRLVGVAYAYLARDGEPEPDLFDGTLDRWHAHPELSPPGRPLTMLHVWFVASPDGPFAGHNPWLAYWAAGLEPPAGWMQGTAEESRVRRLALALAESVEPMRFSRFLQLDAGVRADIEARRSAIAAAVPRLAESYRAGDRARWNAEADAAIAQWTGVRDIYVAAVPLPQARERLAAFYQEMESGAHVH